MSKQFYNADEVAGIMGMCKSKVYDLIRRDIMPNVKIDKRYLVPVGRFHEWLVYLERGGVVDAR